MELPEGGAWKGNGLFEAVVSLVKKMNMIWLEYRILGAEVLGCCSE